MIGFAGELVDPVEFLLWKVPPETRLNGDRVDIRQHLLHHIRINRVKAEAVTEHEVVRIILPLCSANDSEVLASNETQEGLIASLMIIAFPCAEKLLVSLLAGSVLWQIANEFDPVRARGIVQWPRTKIRPAITNDVVWILSAQRTVVFYSGVEPWLAL